MGIPLWARHGLLSLAALSMLSLPTNRAEAQYFASDGVPPSIPWYELIGLRAFADAYASVNYNFPKPQADANLFRAYDTSNGFGLSWVGLDARIVPEPVGGTVSLRLGPSADELADTCLHENQSLHPCDGDVGLQYLSQAFGSWKPGGPEGSWQLDFGKFDAELGVERDEAQYNANYTRGLIYSLAQPRFFTGIRARVEPIPRVHIDLWAANGQNASLDNNAGKTFGANFLYRPVHAFRAHVAWVMGPEQDDSAEVACPGGKSYSAAASICVPDPVDPPPAVYGVSRGGANEFDAFRHHGELAVGYFPGDHLGVQALGIYGLEGVRSSLATDEVESVSWFGASLTARAALGGDWNAAIRGEYYSDPEGRTTGIVDSYLASATLTFDVSIADALLLRLDTRADFSLGAGDDEESGARIFPEGVTNRFGPRDARTYQITNTLGVIGYTN